MKDNNIFKEFIGIDVSKDKLDIYISKTGNLFQISNSSEDINRFISSQPAKDELLVVIDLTGGYEELCVTSFYESGFHVHRAEGRRVKSFLRAMNQKAKTDIIDARGLAKYGEKMQENLILYEPPRNSIKSQIERLCDLKNLLQIERNRLKAPAQTINIQNGIKRHIKFLEQEIQELEYEVMDIISSDKEMSGKHEIITSVKGVGEKTSMILLAHMPELGKINRRKIAALAGVAPYARDSGKMYGYRTTKGHGGRPQVKKALFICALVAIRYDDKMKAFYDNLCARGKKKMVAITAVMRKIIIILNAKIKALYHLG